KTPKPQNPWERVRKERMAHNKCAQYYDQGKELYSRQMDLSRSKTRRKFPQDRLRGAASRESIRPVLQMV
ncbi:MAG: hypothetical protein P4M11_10865, partial [Candidatus Pacebacteria bacterium]|nr:hypothetical protein [Candidatus Paceibacterota bacterium]